MSNTDQQASLALEKRVFVLRWVQEEGRHDAINPGVLGSNIGARYGKQFNELFNSTNPSIDQSASVEAELTRVNPETMRYLYSSPRNQVIKRCA